MSKDLANFERSVSEAADAKALAAELIAAAGHRSEFDAHAVLASHPGLARFPSIVIDLAYEEFCRHMDAGTRVDPQQFVHRFPAVADSLLKVLEVHEYLDANPDAFTAQSQAAWPQAGEDIAGFTLLREIGRGGSSRVFLAREQKLGNREVVVKISRHANGEAAWLGQLNHPHIMPVFSVTLAGATVICMPYLGSATLADVLAEAVPDDMASLRGADVVAAVERTRQRHRAPAPARAGARGAESWTLRRGSYVEALAKIGADLGDALDYAHRQGICHCDVKPSNVLLTAEGRALLLDFNLSMQRGGAAAVVGGTLPYMAPEQLQFLLAASAESLPQIDHRADLFSLGVTLFQLFTGRLPFAVEDLPEDRVEAARQLIERQRSQVDLRADLTRVAGPEIADVIADCLAFDRDDRPTEAQQVARRLRRYLSPVLRVRRWVRQRRRGVAATALVVAFAGAGLAAVMALRPPYHERQLQAGLASLDSGDYLDAIECFDAIDSVEKTGVVGEDWVGDAILLRGWARFKAAQDLGEPGRTECLGQALKDFTVSWRRERSPESEASLAQCSEQLLRREFALDCYRNAIAGGMRTYAVLNNFAYHLNRADQSEEATEMLRMAVEAFPELAEAHYGLARIRLFQAGKARTLAEGFRRFAGAEAAEWADAEVADTFRSAIDHIEIARLLSPRSGEMEFSAACVYATASTGAGASKDQAEEYLNKAVEASFAAVELGLSPGRLREVSLLAPSLRGNSVFQMLMAMPEPLRVAAPVMLTLDVFPAIRQRLARSGG